MVCLGNICRSPLAHGILQHKVDQRGLKAIIDSAGTNGLHDGEYPDSRSMEIALINGIDISYQRSRQIKRRDIEYFDLIYVMDSSNYNNVLNMTESEAEAQKVIMIMNELESGKNINVPDPYYGGEEGFKNVFEMLDKATDLIIEKHLS
ncbi:Putative low molecular weight protein-tyrosine-phosphatase [Parvicella tangerina]|uniref:protein-tyrosine-phosphatase n=2 Tax=Parvicella tangerina TaxID=2829795 RepID=A0A916NQM2_9FLAO|nr:Putative low molecular weight protein-tyrosine-phosphatase [Parvicella tangerina]